MRYNLSRIPREPGVYLFRDWNSRIIYVGMSVNKSGGMRTRISQYFSRQILEIDPMGIASVFFLVTSDAYVLEQQLIVHFHMSGEPLRNKQISWDMESSVDPNIVSKFHVVDIWDNPQAVRKMAKSRAAKLQALIKENEQMFRNYETDDLFFPSVADHSVFLKENLATIFKFE